MIVYTAGTGKGPDRIINEDRVLVNGEVFAEGERYGITDHALLAVVCDGVDGEKGGALAAQEAASGFLRSDPEELTINTLMQRLIDINQSICEKQHLYPEFGRMATTIAGISLNRNDILYWHMGDSRIYEYSSGGLVQLTEDHTVAQNLIRNHQYLIRDHQYLIRDHCGKPERQVTDIDRNTLTSYIGSKKRAFRPSIKAVTRDPGGTLFLLCSDGVYKNVSANEMVSVIRRDTALKEKKTAILQLAKQNGCEDDASLVIISTW